MPRTKLRCRQRTSTSSWWTRVTCTMVRVAFPYVRSEKLTLSPGTGLSDGFPPGGVDGHEVSEVVVCLSCKCLNHVQSRTSSCSSCPTTLWLSASECSVCSFERETDDGLCSHELYIYNNTYDMYKTFAPKLNGRYLSSNVNITVVDKHGKSVSVPVGGMCICTSRCETTDRSLAERYVKFKTRKCALCYQYPLTSC